MKTIRTQMDFIGRAVAAGAAIGILASTAFTPVTRAADLSVMAKVGEREDRVISSQHPYPAGSPQNPSVREWTVTYPGASYIKVHFSRFDLAAGDTLEILSPDGSEQYLFRDKGYKNLERDFWGNSVIGDTAILRLTSTGLGGYGFDIDYLARGIVPLFGDGQTPPASESVCGTQDWQDAACYVTSNPVEYDRSKRGIVVLFNGFNNCSGFKVGCPNQFMTNQHCIGSQADVNATEVRFEFQTSQCGSGSTGFTQSYLGDQFVKADFTLDYCLFTTLGSSPAYVAANIDARQPPVGERIYISGHPNGGPKKLSIVSNSNAGGLCLVDSNNAFGNAAGTDLGYFCDTAPGSSGSPVWSGVSNDVIAIHHFGGCQNQGVRMDKIFPQISSMITSCGPMLCGNGLIDSGEQCDGTMLGGATCVSLGFQGGTLSCGSSCSYDTSACIPFIPCADISGLRGRCTAGTLSALVKLTNTTHNGQPVTISVDGVNSNATIAGSKAQLNVSAATGAHTVALVNPSGCVTPITVTCP